MTSTTATSYRQARMASCIKHVRAAQEAEGEGNYKAAMGFWERAAEDASMDKQASAAYYERALRAAKQYIAKLEHE